MPTLILGLLALSSIAPTPALDYEKLVRETPWDWAGEHASLLYGVTQHLSDYTVEILCPRREETRWPPLVVRIFDGGKQVHSFTAHRETVFTRFGDVLYVAEPARSTTGCTVYAYDLKTGKELWRTRLQSRSNRPHSAYSNMVTVELFFSDALLVRGNESLLRYIEFVDLKTGKTLAKREYPRD